MQERDTFQIKLNNIKKQYKDLAQNLKIVRMNNDVIKEERDLMKEERDVIQMQLDDTQKQYEAKVTEFNKMQLDIKVQLGDRHKICDDLHIMKQERDTFQ